MMFVNSRVTRERDNSGATPIDASADERPNTSSADKPAVLAIPAICCEIAIISDSVAIEFTPTSRIEEPKFANSAAGTFNRAARRPNAVADASTDTSVVVENCCTSFVNSATSSDATFNCPASVPMSVMSDHDAGILR